MTTNKDAEALLRWARALDDRLSKDFGIPKSAEFILDESLDRIIAEATAQQAAEVARLREALAEAMGWLERSDREQNVHQFRHGMSMLRAALAVDPAVAPAPDPAPPAPGERCSVCAHEVRWHTGGSCDCEGSGVAGLCPCPEPAP